MTQSTYVNLLETALADMVFHFSSQMSEVDLNRFIPLLTQAADNGNYEAALLVALHFDPQGCLFPDFESYRRQKSLETAKRYYALAGEHSAKHTSTRAVGVHRFAADSVKKLDGLNRAN